MTDHPDLTMEKLALGEALIAWAADEEHVRNTHELHTLDLCKICEVPLWIIDHKPDCLHERAKRFKQRTKVGR
jgi:hypothetical protein